MGKLEVLGFALTLLMVICNARQSIWGWPLAISSSAIYAVFFAQVKLYGDALLQLLFIALAVWGWWQWLHFQRKASIVIFAPRSLTPLQISGALLGWFVLWWPMQFFLAHFTDAAAPRVDAFITSGSIVATILLARQFIANWWIWLAVNVVSTALFIYKTMWLTAILYAILTGMSIYGWKRWRRVQQQTVS